MKALTNFKINFINFFKWLRGKITGEITELEIEDVNTALENALRKKNLQVLLLKKEISNWLWKKYGYSQSKFIPSRKHNKTELYMKVNCKYGERMSKLQLELTPNLTWK